MCCSNHRFTIMKYANQIGALAAVAVIASCFLPWIIIPDLQIKVSGFASEGTRFGKPGLMNAIMSGIAFFLFLIPAVWAKRANLFFTGFNLAWAIRNYILLTICHGGDCAVKTPGLYLYLGATIVQLLMAVFPNLPLDENR
jgi:hypothetical protein